MPAQPSETPGEPETPIEPSETPAEAGETPTKPGETPTEPGEPEPEPASAKSPESASADPLRAWYLGVFGGARLGPFSEVSPRFAIEGRWMPAQVWLGLAFESGSPYTVRESDFEGRFIDVGSELALGWTQRLGRFMAAGVSGSLAVYVSHLSGTVLPDEDSVSVVRVNPVFYARAEVQLKQGRFTLYLQPAIGLWLQRQNYLVRGLSLVHTERLTGRIVLGLQVAVD